ncbi:gluconate 2-dehydrogenase subunit 3 family protein (plasmid) [Cupriavidus pinatubonensis]|uniref:gluconate 2-dehydrogenase subunit 3 family protein n=1 Tax=Cupriavidus pinatubonensis TaxID=248026 RepID=UPI001C72F563|nr:gluconate 2-dehydrogenase subunit 3 family protein [Cupriavidus pinatubonensis]QYY33792.1 gluconate 2-dehydrogenase subunit 3 family protein [Cupriavidus pinatubonensis]
MEISRRGFLQSVGAAGVSATSTLIAPAHGATPKLNKGPKGALDAQLQAYTFFLPDEAAFVEAAVDVFIPHDDIGPGGVESGIVYFIDQQLAGAFGTGFGLNYTGPFRSGTPSQGFQLPLTPAEIYRIGIREMNAWCHSNFQGQTFAQLHAVVRDRLLRQMQLRALELPTVPPHILLGMVYSNTMEGYFSDPAYGGNRNKGAWRMLGYPGVARIYTADIRTYQRKRQVLPPQSIADFR